MRIGVETAWGGASGECFAPGITAHLRHQGDEVLRGAVQGALAGPLPRLRQGVLRALAERHLRQGRAPSAGARRAVRRQGCGRRGVQVAQNCIISNE